MYRFHIQANIYHIFAVAQKLKNDVLPLDGVELPPNENAKPIIENTQSTVCMSMYNMIVILCWYITQKVAYCDL